MPCAVQSVDGSRAPPVPPFGPFSTIRAPPTSRATDLPASRETPRDKVAYTARPREKELLLTAVLSCEQGSYVRTKALVDTGSGLDYLTVSSVTRRVLDVTPLDTKFTVAMANDATVTISEKVTALVTLYSGGSQARTVTLDLFLFPDDDKCEEAFLLLGRSGIRAFDLHTSPGSVHLRDGTVLVDNNDTVDACRLTAVQPVEQVVDDVLSKMVRQGFGRLFRADGAYSWRLRPLEGDEIRDTPSQTHTLEVTLPEPATADRGPVVIRNVELAARSHYLRLTPELRAKSDSLVQEYIDLKFWSESTADECASQCKLLPTPVFLIGGKSAVDRKPRIVCNFAPVNDTLPKASSSNLIPSHLLAALRLVAPSVVSVSDATKAFYKIRIGSDRVWLVAGTPTGIRHYLSPRLCFGLAVGPSALQTTMSALFSHSVFRGYTGWYADDLTQGGTPDDVLADSVLIERLLQRVGHAFQPAKSSLICHPSMREVMDRMLVGEARTVATTAKVFGAELSYSATGLQLTCANESKRSALQQLADLTATSPSLTKKQFFGLGGTLSYDLSKQHVEARVLGDCLRSLIGREFSHRSWTTPLDLSLLSPRGAEALGILSSWAAELLDGITDCQHAVAIPAPEGPSEIRVYVDASMTGGAFVILCGATVLWQDAWKWASVQSRWHINRQEGFALLAACQVLSDVLSVSAPPGLQVSFFCDNRSAVSWANASNDLCGKQARRALLRLADALGEELRVIRRYARVEVVHLPGVDNVAADRLSRLCSRVGPSNVTLFELLEPVKISGPSPTASQSGGGGDGCSPIAVTGPTAVASEDPAADLAGSEFDPEGRGLCYSKCGSTLEYRYCAGVEDSLPQLVSADAGLADILKGVDFV